MVGKFFWAAPTLPAAVAAAAAAVSANSPSLLPTRCPRDLVMLVLAAGHGLQDRRALRGRSGRQSSAGSGHDR